MSTRFGALDAMRGVAAAAVVLFHVGQVKLCGDLMNHAYLAVDFFFILSGFVIAYTYEQRLRDGLGVGAFLLRRLIRLYPMALFAVMLGAVVLALKAGVDPSRVDPPGRLAAGVATNLLMMPSPFGGHASFGFLFPGNGPMWSIFLEMLINVVWCVVLTRLDTRLLAIVVGASFLAAAICVIGYDSGNLGFDWRTLPGGLARVSYGFGLGVLLFRWKDQLIVARSTMLKIVGVVVLVAIFAMPKVDGLDAAWDLVCMSILMPAVVVLGLNSGDDPTIDRLFGEASYPLYAIHFPILLLASGVHEKLPHLPVGPLLAATVLGLGLATYLVIRFYDVPVRRALTLLAMPARAPGAVEPPRWPAVVRAAEP